MLTEEVKRDKKEHPEELHHYIGACRFCGQMSELETVFEWDAETSNEAATEKCDCVKAQIYTRKKHAKERAAQAIEKKFGDDAGEARLPKPTRDFLNRAVDVLVEDGINKATVSIGRIKVQLSMTSKGNIKIECTLTKKAVEEI